jgi:hypothetical protein
MASPVGNREHGAMAKTRNTRSKLHPYLVLVIICGILLLFDQHLNGLSLILIISFSISFFDSISSLALYLFRFLVSNDHRYSFLCESCLYIVFS